jgi:hypothetical protein
MVEQLATSRVASFFFDRDGSSETDRTTFEHLAIPTWVCPMPAVTDKMDSPATA